MLGSKAGDARVQNFKSWKTSSGRPKFGKITKRAGLARHTAGRLRRGNRHQLAPPSTVSHRELLVARIWHRIRNTEKKNIKKISKF